MSTLFRWTGALLFLASLLSLPLMYFIRLRTPAVDDGSAAGDAIANVVLFTVFALHHSIMARAGAKAWIATHLPAGLERSVYVWIASLLFLAVCLMWQPLPGTVWAMSGAGTLLYLGPIAGVALTIAAARVVGVWELAGVKQPDAAAPIEFKVAGPFAIVRHPIYLGWVLMVFATPVMTASQLLFAGVSTAYLVAAIPLEERSLAQAHPAYRAYQAKMRWRLIPFVW